MLQQIEPRHFMIFTVVISSCAPTGFAVHLGPFHCRALKTMVSFQGSTARFAKFRRSEPQRQSGEIDV